MTFQTPTRLTLDEALACGEVLASDTTEATHVIRVGDAVYKFLRPSDQFLPATCAERHRQLALRVLESFVHVEVNPITYQTRSNVIVSKFVEGRCASTREADSLSKLFIESCRGYMHDLSPPNIKITFRGPVVVDFEVADHLPDWAESLSAQFLKLWSPYDAFHS
jgi:hypothetical protein